MSKQINLERVLVESIQISFPSFPGSRKKLRVPREFFSRHDIYSSREEDGKFAYRLRLSTDDWGKIKNPSPAYNFSVSAVGILEVKKKGLTGIQTHDFLVRYANPLLYDYIRRQLDHLFLDSVVRRRLPKRLPQGRPARRARRKAG